MGANKPIQSVRNTFQIAETLAKLGGSSVTELADHVDMPKSTAHDYLRTMDEEGYVKTENGEYKLSYRFLDLGGKIRKRDKLYSVGRTELRKLADEVNEMASLVIEEQGQAVALHTEHAGSLRGPTAHTGGRAYLHAPAAGKAILAHTPEKRREEILKEHGLPEITENTITNRETLNEELSMIREQGYAIDQEEVFLGVRGLATIIKNKREGAVEGAISIYGPTGGTDIDELRDRLFQAANVIEVNMTYE
jgi:DNA-binding IclR family transcriptional regulator